MDYRCSRILDLQIEDLNKRLRERQLRIEMTDAAKDLAVSLAYDPIYGARPLKRFLQARVETLVARAIVGGDLAPGTILTVDRDGDTLTVRTED